jgi:hypothetical protein
MVVNGGLTTQPLFPPSEKILNTRLLCWPQSGQGFVAREHTRVVPKVSVLIFYLNAYWTYLKLQVISFKI